MSTLTIGWEYLTGYAVATDPGSRERAEWPPHPARLFMALAAAWFETGEDAAEGAALRWIESLGDPKLKLPHRGHVFERSAVTVYVPVNDKADAYKQPDKKKKATLYPHLGSVAIGRNRQPRIFPRVWVGDQPCLAHWPHAEDVEAHRAALSRLCGKVTRIGHSSSLVRMWLTEDEPVTDGSIETWIPDEGLAEFQVRRVSPGTLDMLVSKFNRSGREQHADLSMQMEAREAAKKKVKGKGAKDRKAAIDLQIKELESQRELLNPHPPIRPSIGLWSGYRRSVTTAASCIRHSHFDTELVILKQRQNGGKRLPLESALAVTRALRGAIMKRSGVQPPPAWISGHVADGEPLRNKSGHLACIPLPFVGHEHADGHLLGVALAFPRSVDREDRGRVLGAMLVDASGQAKVVNLTLGRLGVWSMEKRDWTETRQALMPETWTANPTGAETWASVTPVVLDRFPKADRNKDRVAWTEEVVDIISESCDRIELSKPIMVDVDTTSWHRGSPRAVVKRRSLRGHGASRGDAALGNGFPFYPAKGTNAPRPQVHVWLRFAQPIIGPVLLGAGRYLGYGLCRPWKES